MIHEMMIPVNRINIPRPVTQNRKASSSRPSAAGGGKFSSFVSSQSNGENQDQIASSNGETLSSVNEAHSLESVLLIQEGAKDRPQYQENQQRARVWGEDMLKELHALRFELLNNDITPTRLEAIRAHIEQRRKVSIDPNLHSILNDIEARALVELIKLNRRQSL